MISLMPEPNQASASATPVNDYFGTGNYSSTHHNIDTKINYNPNEKSAIFARYSISPSNIFDPPGLGMPHHLCKIVISSLMTARRSANA